MCMCWDGWGAGLPQTPVPIPLSQRPQPQPPHICSVDIYAVTTCWPPSLAEKRPYN